MSAIMLLVIHSSEFLNLPPHEYKPIIPKIPFKNSNYTKPGAYSPMSNEVTRICVVASLNLLLLICECV